MKLQFNAVDSIYRIPIRLSNQPIQVLLYQGTIGRILGRCPEGLQGGISLQLKFLGLNEMNPVKGVLVYLYTSVDALTYPLV
jgi:hypothetical protein